MSKAHWRPTTRAPSWKTARKLAATTARPHVQPYSKLRPLGGTRWAVVFGLRAKRRDEPRLELLVLDKAKGSWRATRLLLADYGTARFRAAKKIVVEGCDKAVKRIDDGKGKHHGGRVLVSVYTSDYDGDGEPEVKVRHRFAGCTKQAPPDEATPPTRLQIVKTVKLGVALDVTLQIGEGPDYYDRYTVKLDHRKDLDGDGYRDLVLRSRYESFLNNLGKLSVDTEERRYHYRPARQIYELVSTKRGGGMEARTTWQ